MLKTFWIVMYHHRHGVDVWPCFTIDAPTQEQMIEQTEEQFEPDREDEYLEAAGPFEVPEEG